MSKLFNHILSLQSQISELKADVRVKEAESRAKEIEKQAASAIEKANQEALSSASGVAVLTVLLAGAGALIAGLAKENNRFIQERKAKADEEARAFAEADRRRKEKEDQEHFSNLLEAHERAIDRKLKEQGEMLAAILKELDESKPKDRKGWGDKV